MTDTYRPLSSTRSVLAAVGVLALALGLLTYAPSAQAQAPPQQSTDGQASTAQANSPITLNRHAGPTRYETSAEIATDAYDASTDVVIASGEEFADALSGAALEGMLDAPVLLVPSDLVNGAIPTATTDAIDDLGATSATILGGDNAVSSEVADYIVDNSTVQDTERVAGATRFETAEQIAGQVGDAGSIPDAVADQYSLTQDSNAAFLATGLNWPDAMAGSPGSFAGQHPILLTTPDELHPAAEGGLEATNTDVVFILGGSAVVGSDVETELEDQGYDVVRLSGADRWATAKEIADTFADDWGFGVQNVGLATGFAFADALASAPYLGNPAPLVLTPTGETHPTTESFFEERGCDIETIDIFGGDAAVEPAVAESYAETACPDGEPTDGPADALTLTPESAANAVDSDHTVNAELSREGDGAITDENVRFEVYPAGGGAAIDASNQEATDGSASFTYSSSTERQDLIVACTGSDPCVTGSNLNLDPATDEPTNIVEDAVADTALKSWETPEAASLVLEPETATNTYGQDHTVTGTVVDQFGNPIEATETVTFEVFRSADGGDTWSQAEQADRTTGADPSDDPAISDPEDTGQASFVYTGPTADAQDMIVGCILASGETDCAEVQTDELGNQAVETTTESTMVDSGEKQWVAPEYSISLSQEETFNEAGTDHTYTGMVTNQFGDPAPSGVDVYTQVYRQFSADDGSIQGDNSQVFTDNATTDAEGAVEFTYAGPLVTEFETRTADGDFDNEDADIADDAIVGCADVTAHADCSALDGSGEVSVNPAVSSDQLNKSWAPVETGVADGTYTGQALRQSRTDNDFVMRTTNDRFIEFETDQGSSDEFTVDGDATADRDRFEMELQFQIANQADHTVAVTLANGAPFTPNTWNLTTASLNGEAISSDFQDISSSGTALGISSIDDDCEQVQMPFAVSFYDVTSVFLQVDTNGYVRVGQTPGGECGDFTNEDLPSGELGRAIGAFWDDLHPSSAGNVYVETLGTSPNRTFVIQYDGLPHFSGVGDSTLQIQIHEGTNDIEVHYQDVDFGNGTYNNGASATIGIQQDEDGPATRYSFNQEAIFDGEALRFNTN